MAKPRVTLSVDGNDLPVDDVAGRVAVGGLFAFTARFPYDVDLPRAQALHGRPFTLTLTADEETKDKVVVHGLVSGVDMDVDARPVRVLLDLAPAVAPLTLGQDSYVYQHMGVPEIVKDVVASAGLPGVVTRWELVGTYAPRVYAVQHRESDWDFVERLLAEEGIYYWFEFGEATTTLVFSDDSTAASAAPGGAELRYVDFGLPTKDLHWASDLRSRSTAVTDTWTHRDYDPKKPEFDLKGKHKAGKGSKEIYDYPGRFDDTADGTRKSKVAVEALHSRKTMAEGRAGTAAIRVGHAFKVTRHPKGYLSDPLFCVEIAYRFLGRRVGTGGGDPNHVVIRWLAIPKKTPFRLPRQRAALKPRGPEIATITGVAGQEIDVSDPARIVAQTPWDRDGRKDDKSSLRMRVGQSALVNSMIHPRVGWQVLVGHHDEDTDRPWVMGRLYDGEHVPPYALPTGSTRMAFQTLTTPHDGSSSEIRYEDRTGEEEIFVNAARDTKVHVGDNQAWQIDHDHTRTIGANQTVKVGADDKLQVTRHQTSVVVGSEALTVRGSRSVTVNGNEKATIGDARKLDVGLATVLDVDGTREVQVLGAMATKAGGNQQRTVLGSLSAKAGASWTTKAGAGMTRRTMGDSSESVVGAKSTKAGGGVDLIVEGDATETIAGAKVVQISGSSEEAAGGDYDLQVAGALLSTAAAVEMQADNEISITVGATTIVIRPTQVEVRSPLVVTTGATITQAGLLIRHNP